MLRDLLDHEMRNLNGFERDIADHLDWSDDATHAVVRECLENKESRIAEILDPKSHPDRWLWELAEFLVTFEDDEILAMAQKSEAAGNPPARFEFVVAMQITAALIRGHLQGVQT